MSKAKNTEPNIPLEFTLKERLPEVRVMEGLPLVEIGWNSRAYN